MNRKTVLLFVRKITCKSGFVFNSKVSMWPFYLAFPCLQDFYISFCPMQANSLPVFDLLGGIFHSNNRR